MVMARWVRAGEASSFARHRALEKSTSKLLEVRCLEDEAASWQWQVRSSGKALVCGLEGTRLKARFAENDALLLLLASKRIM
jgi:hypothetical protein